MTKEIQFPKTKIIFHWKYNDELLSKWLVIGYVDKNALKVCL